MVDKETGDSKLQQNGANYSASRWVPVPMALGITTGQPAHKTLTLSCHIKNLVITLSMQFIYLHLFCYLNTMPKMKNTNFQLTSL
jgi:hypothetical protein